MITRTIEPRINRRSLLKLAGAGALGAGAVPILTGCGDSDASSAEQLNAPDVEAAKEEGLVNIYTSVDTAALDAINAAFTEKYGIQVEYFRGDSQDAISRVLNEANAQAVQADVVETSDSTGIMYLKDEGITRAYQSPEAENFPAVYQDPDHFWTYTRLTLGVIAYNDAGLEAAPTSWEELAGPPFSDSLAYFSDSQGSGAARLWTIAENLGWDLLEAWAAASPLRVETPQLLRQTLERGERLVGIAQNDNHALSSQQDSDGSMRFAVASEGVPLEPAAISVTAEAPHPNAALLYHDFWLSEEGMQVLVDVGKKYVAREEMSQPEGAVPLDEITLMVPDYQKYIEERDTALTRLQEIFGGEWGL